MSSEGSESKMLGYQNKTSDKIKTKVWRQAPMVQLCLARHQLVGSMSPSVVGVCGSGVHYAAALDLSILRQVNMPLAPGPSSGVLGTVFSLGSSRRDLR